MVQNPTLADMGKTGLQLSNSNFEEKKHGIAVTTELVGITAFCKTK